MLYGHTGIVSAENCITGLNKSRWNVEKIKFQLDLIFVVTVLGIHDSPHFMLNYWSLEKKIDLNPFKSFSEFS